MTIFLAPTSTTWSSPSPPGNVTSFEIVHHWSIIYGLFVVWIWFDKFQTSQQWGFIPSGSESNPKWVIKPTLKVIWSEFKLLLKYNNNTEYKYDFMIFIWNMVIFKFFWKTQTIVVWSLQSMNFRHPHFKLWYVHR